MLLAACADFARIPGCTVLTTWDARLGAFPLANVRAAVVRHPADERAAFERLCGESDAVLVIAPEFDALLADRQTWAARRGTQCLGSSPEAIELAADKLRLAAHLRQFGLPTIETEELPGSAAAWSWPDGDDADSASWVIKPRFGAGSLHAYRVSVREDFETVLRAYADLGSHWPAVRQPHVAGQAASVGVLVGRNPFHVDVFPPGAQRLSNDGRFQYLGGQISGTARLSAEHEAIVRRACESIPGLAGYAGLDILFPADDPERLVIVEINPRLTTSYLGYRALAQTNLMARLIDRAECSEAFAWSHRTVRFAPDGTLETTE